MVKRTIFIFLLIFFGSLLFADIVFTAVDKPNDDGSAIILNWEIIGDKYDEIQLFKRDKSSEFSLINSSPEMQGSFIDSKNINPKIKYSYKINALKKPNRVDGISAIQSIVVASETTSCIATQQWFNTGKISVLILSLILSISIIWFILTAKQGKELYIRRIAGLESMDESVGRATEMGRPILYIPGTLDLDDMQTIAGLTILGKLAGKAAEYNAEIIVPVCRSMVLSTAREIVKEAYLKVGKLDMFKPDSVFYLTDDQFGFVAGVDGIIVREKPAANFFMGAFYAESLILAETGFASGAIQTAGTAMPSQLPFFVTACDYTLIGEELFAASAYLSKDPQQLGSLKGQDIGKAVFLVVLITGIVLEIFNIPVLKDFLTSH